MAYVILPVVLLASPRANAARAAPASAASADASADRGVRESYERFQKGPARHDLLRAYPEVVVEDVGGERRTLHRVDDTEAYHVAVRGPGELTLHQHRLLDPALAESGRPAEFTAVIIEDDVLLERAECEVSASSVWSLVGDHEKDLRVSTSMVYRLALGERVSHFTIQSTGDGEGSLMSYSFVAKEKGAKAVGPLVLDENLGLTTPASRTTVTVVEVRETVVGAGGAPRFAFGLSAGGGLSVRGAGLGPLLATDVGVMLPMLDGAVWVGAEFLLLYQSPDVRVASATGGTRDISTDLVAVPMHAVVGFRYPIFGVVTAYASIGGGAAYVWVHRALPGVMRSESAVARSLRATLGLERDAGPGAVGVYAAYLHAETRDYGAVLSDYAPTGLQLAFLYRFML